VSFDEIFNPGIRHWKEFQDWQEDKFGEAPAPGPGPEPGPVRVDLDKEIITFEEPVDSSQASSSPPGEASENVDQGGDEDRTE